MSILSTLVQLSLPYLSKIAIDRYILSSWYQINLSSLEETVSRDFIKQYGPLIKITEEAHGKGEITTKEKEGLLAETGKPKSRQGRKDTGKKPKQERKKRTVKRQPEAEKILESQKADFLLPKEKPTEKAFSTHFEKIKESLGAEESVEIERITNKDQLRRAFNYIQQNPQNAMQIAYGFREPPPKIKVQAIRLSMVESLKEAGKLSQAIDIAKLFSSELTEAAQTLNLAKADLGQQDERAVNAKITTARLERIGEKLGEKEPEKALEKAKKKIKTETKEATKEVVEEQSKVTESTLKDLDNLIDTLLC